jgi:hypothetical protein
MLPRQWAAWKNAWASDLVAEVREVEDGFYLVPSVSDAGRMYGVEYVPFPAGSGYVYLCSCPAGKQGAVACRHAAAVHAWRLERRLGFRLRNPLCPRKEGSCLDPKAPPASTH